MIDGVFDSYFRQATLIIEKQKNERPHVSQALNATQPSNGIQRNGTNISPIPADVPKPQATPTAAPTLPTTQHQSAPQNRAYPENTAVPPLPSRIPAARPRVNNLQRPSTLVTPTQKIEQIEFKEVQIKSVDIDLKHLRTGKPVVVKTSL
jgi:hypothetical protein